MLQYEAAFRAHNVDGARLRSLRPGVTYRFRRLEVIPNPEHTLKYGGRRVSDFVHKHFVRTDGAPRSDAVAVLKTAGGATSQGVLCPDRTAAILRRQATPGLGWCGGHAGWASWWTCLRRI